MEPITLVDETLNNGTELLFEEHDLPAEFDYGTKLRKTVTYYAGESASVQVHGIEREPIEIEGTVDDSWWGLEGHAERFVNNAYALAASGHLFRFEYKRLQLWGTFDFTATWHTDGWYDYRATFSPFWAQNPNFVAFVDFAQPPAEIPVELVDEADELVAAAEAAPDGLDLSFVQALVFDCKRAASALNAPLGVLDGVATYAELTESQVRQVARSMNNAADAAGRAITRTGDAAMGALAATPAAQVLGYEYNADVRLRLRALRARILATIRELIRAIRPVRSTTHVVRDGDTLARLAQEYLGDFGRWTEIADANDLLTPTLTTGQVLDIPPKERPA